MNIQDERREYLRIRVPGLIARYNVLDTDDALLFLPRRQQTYTVSPEGEEELEPVFQLILEKLERLELKIDHLLQWVGRGEDRKAFQYTHPVVDISGGGISLWSDAPLEVGKLLEICILSEIGEMPPLFVIGRVCWIKEEETGAPTLSSHLLLHPPLVEGARQQRFVGVEFEDIYEEDRQTIVRMVFHAERKYRKERIPGK